jgi:hypothetical protein
MRTGKGTLASILPEKGETGPCYVQETEICGRLANVTTFVFARPIHPECTMWKIT